MDYEAWLRQHGGQQIQNMAGPNSPMAQGTDQATNAAMMKLAALHQQGSGAAPVPQGGMPPQQPIPLPQQDLAQPNAPTMSAPDAQSRMNSMIQAPLTMQQVQAKLRQQADQDAASEAHANSLQDDPMSGYSDVPSRFAGLKQQVGSPSSSPTSKSPTAKIDIKDKTNRKQALSEDQEAALNKQLSGDDDDEDEKATAGVKQTGTLGGV